MPVDAIRIERRLWSGVSAPRRKEWETLIAELLEGERPWPGRSGSSLTIGCDEITLTLELETDGALTSVRVPRSELASVLSEYLAIIARLQDDGLPMAQAEAIDMAKKVVHDDGAKRLGALIPDLSPSHEVRRRFFSLVVALASDTTDDEGAHSHL